ncbi:hypothetical protein C5Y96_05350 [Blastopirellula marina]|uniref:Uncharacterized protein n=1 Tax=Blastopirellula marina TaxID=124 RepID=A0A2S8G4A0_9BACT|nr:MULTISPECIES: hypothetical protein [Pirellulaceae]PQO39282.1 hypothetical protein C5Y96_05350 [Blastopirellula marina]RCS55590.1 hypothetical protein DTL36_05360 [Bremerella cremea]
MNALKAIFVKPIYAAALLLVLGAPSWAWACPTCKNGLSDNYVSAYAFSILFMMIVPYVLLASFFSYIVVCYLRRPATERKELSADELSEIALKKAKQGIPTQPPAFD